MNLKLISIESNGVIRIASEGNITAADFRGEAPNPMEGVIGSTWANNRVLLDFEKTDYIDSSGVGWLISTNGDFKRQGGKLIVHSIRPQVRQLLDLLKVGKVVSLVENEAAATALVNGGQK
ncbi:MAG TPA: STAS domain-containing protein [Tepidisphaeraceae bacterium]|jgi:anti-anti-sigma factor